jgi:hypothetical protein
MPAYSCRSIFLLRPNNWLHLLRVQTLLSGEVKQIKLNISFLAETFVLYRKIEPLLVRPTIRI